MLLFRNRLLFMMKQLAHMLFFRNRLLSMMKQLAHLLLCRNHDETACNMHSLVHAVGSLVMNQLALVFSRLKQLATHMLGLCKVSSSLCPDFSICLKPFQAPKRLSFMLHMHAIHSTQKLLQIAPKCTSLPTLLLGPTNTQKQLKILK